MSEPNQPLLHISDGDVREANQLSLHCPICSNAVERNPVEQNLVPVACDSCHTLYHKVCWEQSGGKCAVLGCDHTEFQFVGRDQEPALKVTYADVGHLSRNGRGPGRQTKRLKDEQRRQVERLRRPGFWRRLWQWLLDQIRIQ